jgi:hypothetical protein
MNKRASDKAKDLSNAAGLEAFCRDRLSFGPTLVCPLMMVWREYKLYCIIWGFHMVSTKAFVFHFEAQRGLYVGTRGKGRRRRFINGIGVLPNACDD